MKDIKVFITSWCPHCKRALDWIHQVKEENPKYRDVKVEIIDEEEHPEISKQFDYYYVPTYYVDGVKIHEGGTTKDIVVKAFEEASK